MHMVPLGKERAPAPSTTSSAAFMPWAEPISLEVLEVDILWPRWVARIGVTRSTQACFLTADRQCTELPLLRLPRLVHEFRGSDPMRQTRDLARVGWRGLAPFLPIGPHERPRLADSFSRLGQARGASPGSLDQRSEEWPLCEGGKERASLVHFSANLVRI